MPGKNKEELNNNSDLKCLHVTTIDLTPYCFLRTWFSYLVQHNFNVSLATTVEQFRSELEATGASVYHIPIARNVNPVSDLRSLIRLYKFIKKGEFHSVHTYTTKAGLIGRLAARLAGTPVIIHSMLEPPHNSARNPILRQLYIWMERFATHLADHIMTTTKPNVDEILAQRLVPKEKLTDVPEGLEIEKYDGIKVDPDEKRKELGIPEGAFFIVTVARLEGPKGHTYLLTAAKQLLDKNLNAYFICVGKGNLRESLEQQAKDLGIDTRVKFLGFREDMLEILKSCDLFVLPSLWEGQGVVLMEASAMKKPLVACKVGGVVEVVDDGRTGILVPPKDPDALAEAIREILEDPEKMRNMGEAGYELIRDHFKDSEFNERRFDVYKKLYEKKLGISLE